MAIHDASYSSRPSSYRELRWRMTYLFEERVGRRISEANLEAAAREEAAVERLKADLG